MPNIIDFAKYRAGRARPPDDAREPDPDEIRLRLQPDGSYEVTISGAYAILLHIAVHHLADVITQLAPTLPR